MSLKYLLFLLFIVIDSKLTNFRRTMSILGGISKNGDIVFELGTPKK